VLLAAVIVCVPGVGISQETAAPEPSITFYFDPPPPAPVIPPPPPVPPIEMLRPQDLIPVMPPGLQQSLDLQQKMQQVDQFASLSPDWAALRIQQEQQQLQQMLPAPVSLGNLNPSVPSVLDGTTSTFQNALSLAPIHRFTLGDLTGAFEKAAHRPYNEKAGTHLKVIESWLGKNVPKIESANQSWMASSTKTTAEISRTAVDASRAAAAEIPTLMRRVKISVPEAAEPTGTDSASIQRALFSMAAGESVGAAEIIRADGYLAAPEVSAHKFTSPDIAFRQQIETKYNQVAKSVPKSPQAAEARPIALSTLVAADLASSKHNVASAELYAKVGIAMADIALGLIPGVGFAKDSYEALTGTSLLTQQPLTSFERCLSVAGMMSFGLTTEGVAAVRAVFATAGESRAFVQLIRKAVGLIGFGREYAFASRVERYGANVAEDLSELEKLNARLGKEEFSSVFTASMDLKPEVVEAAKEIELAAPLKNTATIAELTADGSKIEDWRKMSYVVQVGKDGRKFDFHFYRNIESGAANFTADYGAYTKGIPYKLRFK
jgi:hypothetical protein